LFATADSILTFGIERGTESLTKQFGSHLVPSMTLARNISEGPSEPLNEQWGLTMSALIDLLYSEYCKARVAEIRKQQAS
jgi:hypothetical protein